MRFLAIFDGLFFAWQWWEIALFKGKNRFAVGGVSGGGRELETDPSRRRPDLTRNNLTQAQSNLTRKKLTKSTILKLGPQV